VAHHLRSPLSIPNNPGACCAAGSLIEIFAGGATTDWSTIEAQDMVLDALDKLEASGVVATDFGGRGTQCWVREFVEVWLPANTAGNGANCSDSVDAGRVGSTFSKCFIAFNMAMNTILYQKPGGVWPRFRSHSNVSDYIPWTYDVSFIYKPTNRPTNTEATDQSFGYGDADYSQGGSQYTDVSIDWTRCWTRFPKPCVSFVCSVSAVICCFSTMQFGSMRLLLQHTDHMYTPQCQCHALSSDAFSAF
jgi:hypothetical protein